MGKLSYGLVLSVAAIAGVGGVQHTAADQTRLPPVVLIVHDRAGVFSAILDLAQKETGRIYRHAGVRLVWRSATSNSSESAAGGNVSRWAQTFTVQVIILPRNDGPATGSTFLMGASALSSRECGGSAYVFYDQVGGFSNVQRVQLTRVLGAVVAHEVGHLLTGQRGHSAEGLMRARWNSGDWERASLGLLLFSAPDSSRIRATLSSCR